MPDAHGLDLRNDPLVISVAAGVQRNLVIPNLGRMRVK